MPRLVPFRNAYAPEAASCKWEKSHGRHGDVGSLLETFLLPTWAEFQRLPQRATQEDRKLEESLRAFFPKGS